MKRKLIAIALLIALSGCTSIRTEYEHLSHPFAGPPFNDVDEAWLDQVMLIGRKQQGRFYSEVMIGYKLTDVENGDGFYGPRVTGGIRVGVELWSK